MAQLERCPFCGTPADEYEKGALSIHLLKECPEGKEPAT